MNQVAHNASWPESVLPTRVSLDGKSCDLTVPEKLERFAELRDPTTPSVVLNASAVLIISFVINLLVPAEVAPWNSEPHSPRSVIRPGDVNGPPTFSIFLAARRF